jgi:hypothetical protein
MCITPHSTSDHKSIKNFSGSRNSQFQPSAESDTQKTHQTAAKAFAEQNIVQSSESKNAADPSRGSLLIKLSIKKRCHVERGNADNQSSKKAKVDTSNQQKAPVRSINFSDDEGILDQANRSDTNSTYVDKGLEYSDDHEILDESSSSYSDTNSTSYSDTDSAFYSDTNTAYIDEGLNYSDDPEILNESLPSYENNESQQILEQILVLEKLEKSKIFSHPDYYENFYSTVVIDERPLKTAYTIGKVEVLTGTLAYHLIPENASKKLRENLKTAKKIIHLVGNAVPFSENYLQRSKIFFHNHPNPNHVTVVQKSLDILRKEIYYGNPLESHVQKIMRYKTGNCGELAAVGFYYATKEHVQAEVVKIQRGDHHFLVIGRNEKFPLFDFKNWGPNAVICDPWTRSYYPASKIEQYLMDCIGEAIIDDNGAQHTIVRHFDPSKQALY